MSDFEYSDYITYDWGSQTRLTRLRLHIQEVSDLISSGNFSLNGTSNSYDYWAGLLKDLKVEERELTEEVEKRSKSRSPFFRGRIKCR